MINNRKLIEQELYNYPLIDGAIRRIDLDIEQIQNDVSIGGMSYDFKGSPTNAISSKVESDVIRREEIGQSEYVLKLQREKNKLIFQKKKIDNALTCLSDTEQELIRLRYFNKNQPTWVNVSVDMGYSEKHCKTIRNKAIDKISMILN